MACALTPDETRARCQKVDLTRISVLALTEKYLAFIPEARSFWVELAADYLVMAAWLAYLKSRLLPPEPAAGGSAAEDLAAHPAFRLEWLNAMREAAAGLMGRCGWGRTALPAAAAARGLQPVGPVAGGADRPHAGLCLPAHLRRVPALCL